MKKFMNDAETILSESLRGFGAAHAGLVRVQSGPTFVTRAPTGLQAGSFLKTIDGLEGGDVGDPSS